MREELRVGKRNSLGRLKSVSNIIDFFEKSERGAGTSIEEDASLHKRDGLEEGVDERIAPSPSKIGWLYSQCSVSRSLTLCIGVDAFARRNAFGRQHRVPVLSKVSASRPRVAIAGDALTLSEGGILAVVNIVCGDVPLSLKSITRWLLPISISMHVANSTPAHAIVNNLLVCIHYQNKDTST